MARTAFRNDRYAASTVMAATLAGFRSIPSSPEGKQSCLSFGFWIEALPLPPIRKGQLLGDHCRCVHRTYHSHLDERRLLSSGFNRQAG